MSAEVVSLEQVRRDKQARAAFGRWQSRLEHRPAADAALSDLPDAALHQLAELGHQATLALYDVVLGVRGLGPGERYPDLEARQKLEALDVFLFLADQVRFEVMVRLGWLNPGPVRGRGHLGNGQGLPQLSSRGRAASPCILPGPIPPTSRWSGAWSWSPRRWCAR